MTTIIVRPGRYRQFGEAEGSCFCLITNSDLKDRIILERTGGYSDYLTLYVDEQDQMEEMLTKQVPERAHVLVVSPNCFVRSPTQEAIGANRKFIAMACNSTPYQFEDVNHFLRMIEETLPDEQQSLCDYFFLEGPEIKHMSIRDDTTGTEAIFKHLRTDYQWNIQAGALDWGEQQIAPSGEISVLPADIWDFRNDLKLDIEGELTFFGLPILHAGEVSFLRQDQQRLFEGLKPLHNSSIIAKVKHGVITSLRSTDKKADSVVNTLEKMFSIDSRYATIWELGFAVNTTLEVVMENRAMNEVYGGNNGCMHFGLGLTPYTQYHLDIICPNTTIYDDCGKVFFAGEKLPLKRISSQEEVKNSDSREAVMS